ncbi:MAG: TadE/TadG family type IV pilus assembly protein, partial [Acidimicrobiales bacterium]
MSRFRRRPDQRGVAALELAIMFTILCLVAVLLAPLPYAMLAKIKLERAAGQAARFATQVPDRSRPGLPA